MTDKTPEELIAERGKTHGSWEVQAAIAQEFKATVNKYAVSSLLPTQREALEMILVKCSRILAGKSTERDHWDDIAGYAKLGKHGHKA